MLFRSRMEERINLHAESARYLEMKRKIVQKGGSKAMHIKVCKTHGRYSVEFKVPSLFRKSNQVLD